MGTIVENLFIGAVGGLLAYWIAHRKFVSQRWWDKRFDLYIKAIEILEKIEHSLAIFEWALERGLTIDNSDTFKDAYMEFERGLSLLHGLQSKMMFVGMDEAHMKLMPLAAGLKAIQPSYLTSDTVEDIVEIKDLVKQSKNMVGGCSGELAIQGRNNLKMAFYNRRKLKDFFIRSRKSS